MRTRLARFCSGGEWTMKALLPGGSAEIRIVRQNLAERRYRVTGGGIYRDTVLLGGDGGVLEGGVLGQDSVLSTVYRGEPFFIWGDTNRPSRHAYEP